MKLRIKGNSIRFRLTRSEVDKLSLTGYLEEQTLFGQTRFLYALQTIAEENKLSAIFTDNKMTMLVPMDFIRDWPHNDIVGFNSNMPITATDTLYLLLEKDFVCLDETTEDQSDNYENPNKSC
jgi:hypothetical protein